ncbi:MAG: glycosyltransferase [Nanoarchaeota archaeon]
MIFVTVSNASFPRLVSYMDSLARQSDHEIIMQIGRTPCTPRFAQFFRFGSRSHLQSCCSSADIVITHGGAGSIIMAVRNGAACICMPRTRRMDKCRDNHQVELVRRLAAQGRVISVESLKDIPAAIKKAERLVTSQKQTIDKEQRLGDAIAHFLTLQ